MFLKRFINICLTVLLLFADSGATIYAHTCLKTKHTHLSIGNPKHCCSDNKSAEDCSIRKSSCCDVSTTYLKQNFVSQPIEVQQFSFAAADFIPSGIFFVGSVISPVAKNIHVNSPPLSAIKSCCNFTQSFRI